MDFNIYFHNADGTENTFLILKKLQTMSEQLDKLTSEVSESTTVMGSAVTLLNGLSGKLKEVQDELAQQGIDNAKLNELSTQLDAGSNDLASAITANTIAEDEEPEA